MGLSKRIQHPWRVGSLAFIGVSLLILLCLPTRTPLVQVEAKTRSVEFTVINGAFSVINFPEAVSLTLSGNAETECTLGTLMPPPDAVMSYDIYRNNLIIQADKPMSFMKKTNQQSVNIDVGGTVAIGPESECYTESHSTIKLPIWGPATLGKRPVAANTSQGSDVFNGLFLYGHGNIYGRNLFGAGLYSAGSLTFPAGSELSTISKDKSTNNSPSWFGYAIYNPHSQTSEVAALQLSASVETRKLQLLRVGTDRPQGNINIGFFTKVTKDPFLSGLGGFLLLCFVACEFLVALITLREWVKS